uniref:Protein kinase domain-containing protein n=1 Tax=Fagus sylvatica TaxID=28930 RepID=A0A2N9I6K1_FAGSY
MLVLERLNLSGTLDAASLCGSRALAASITAIFLVGNNIGGGIPAEIANCKQLTHLHLSGNQFSGSLPNSLAMLDNQLSGEIPKLDFCNLVYFNVSNNNFSGLIPDVGGRFSISSFLGNPELCGNPVPKECPPVPEKGDNQSNGDSKDQTVMYTGYVVLALACLMLIIFKLCKRKKRKERLEGLEAVNKVAVVDDSVSKVGASSIEYKSGVSRSEYMGNSSESALVLNSVVVLENTAVNGLKLEDLLSAPAELLGRGKHGTLYKVMFENGILVFKRIKDWAISCNEFEQRMKRINQVKHRNVLPTLAFYCSKYEKLLVYEYQQNTSLFILLHGFRGTKCYVSGNHMGETFDWASRLGVAASIAEALAFMHQELKEDGIAHGNLKSSNILLNKNMEPCISEYGLMAVDSDQYGSSFTNVQNNGVELADWVHSVVQEEWTVEVFDKSLISEGASEERMVNLLQVAIKCVDHSPEGRPSMNQVSVIINTIKEEDDRSIAFEASQG